MLLHPDWPPTPTFTTARLLVRPWLRADLDAMAAWPAYSAPLDRVWNWPREMDGASAELLFWIRSSDPRRREWTIATGDEVLGYLSIREIDSAGRSARLGIGLGAPYVGQGYGGEALRAFVNWYFGELSFRVLRLDVAAHNARARRLYGRLGFGELRRFWQDAGAAEDFAFLSEPLYAGLREHFDVRGGRVLVEVIEMELTMA